LQTVNRSPDTIPEGRRQREDGRRSRASILDTAARLATVKGLDGLSIGELAEDTGMSKSGLYAHFKSKEELQIATIDRASEIFEAEVLEPARTHGEGLRLLWALADEFISHLQRDVFPGGCFFAAVGAEFSGRPGRVKERVVRFTVEWLNALEAAVTQAQAAGELPDSPEPRQLAYEVHALLLMGHATYTTFGDPAFLERSRRGLERLLGPRPA
jgi:AcrR family transcriptional regulator